MKGMNRRSGRCWLIYQNPAGTQSLFEQSRRIPLGTINSGSWGEMSHFTTRDVLSGCFLRWTGMDGFSLVAHFARVAGIHDPASFVMTAVQREAASRYRPILGVADGAKSSRSHARGQAPKRRTGGRGIRPPQRRALRHTTLHGAPRRGRAAARPQRKAPGGAVRPGARAAAGGGRRWPRTSASRRGPGPAPGRDPGRPAAAAGFPATCRSS